MNALLKLEVGTPLSERELKKMIFRKGVRFIDYDRIPANATIKTLLPGRGFAGLVIFYKDAGHKNSGVGHWVCLFRHPRSGTHYFDSLGYGLRGDAAITGNDNRLLKILQNHNVTQNTTVFQRRVASVQDCARHVACRLNFAHMKPQEYREFMQWRGMKADVIVTLLTLSQSRLRQHVVDS